MPAAYSQDLRQKVVEAVDRGVRKTQVCRMFNISRNTLDLWLKRRAATGSVQAAHAYQRGHDPNITDWEQFRAFVQQHGDKTQAEMAQLWGAEISVRSISRALSKIGWTRKKRRTATPNAMR
jgi:transposase